MTAIRHSSHRQMMTVAQTRSLSALSSLEPLVAVFAIILAVVSPWSSKRRPWKGGKDRMTVAKGFLVASLPFVLAEAGDSLGADRPAVDTAGGRDGDGCTWPSSWRDWPSRCSERSGRPGRNLKDTAWFTQIPEMAANSHASTSRCSRHTTASVRAPSVRS